MFHFLSYKGWDVTPQETSIVSDGLLFPDLGLAGPIKAILFVCLRDLFYGTGRVFVLSCVVKTESGCMKQCVISPELATRFTISYICECIFFLLYHNKSLISLKQIPSHFP